MSSKHSAILFSMCSKEASTSFKRSVMAPPSAEPVFESCRSRCATYASTPPSVPICPIFSAWFRAPCCKKVALEKKWISFERCRFRCANHASTFPAFQCTYCGFRPFQSGSENPVKEGQASDLDAVIAKASIFDARDALIICNACLHSR